MVKQRRIEGSITEYKAGFRIWVSGGKDAAGNRLRLSEVIQGNRKDANRRLRELVSSIESGKYIPERAETLDTFISRWWLTKKSSVAPTTALNYERLIKRYVRKSLGKKRLQSIKPINISALISSLVEQDRIGQADHVYVLLRLIFNSAIEMGALAVSPMRGISRPRQPHRAMQTMTPDQVHMALEYLAMKDSWALLPVAVLVSTGLRRSELLGLRWSDIDLEKAVLFVQRSYHVLPKGVEVIKDPKTRRSRRLVALDHHTISLLKAHRAQAETNSDLIGEPFSDSGYVFARVDGKPWRPNSLTQVWIRMRDRLGIDARLHDLRHTSVSIMLAAGISARLISERVGHSSTSFTMDTYGHLLPDAQAEAAEKLASVLNFGDQKAIGSSAAD